MKADNYRTNLLMWFAISCAMATSARAQTFSVLYSFTGGTDGGGVGSSVVMDKQGNLYGTTTGGGAYGYGTVFELSPNADGTWTETVLHSFKNGDPDGQEPDANLVLDAAGNLYGTTPTGGKHKVGTAFELMSVSGGWTLNLLYTFGSYKGDAGPPRGGLVFDSKGNLYGAAGGGMPGAGAVFELSPSGGSWIEKVLYNFGSSEALGIFPFGNMTFDSVGNLYGSTSMGGDMSCVQDGGGGCGVVYKLWRSNGWKETVLHIFTGGSDGINPAGGPLVFDAKGNLYGSTLDGGSTGCAGGGCGTVFKLSVGVNGWREGVIHQFGNGGNGSNPVGGLVFDQAGNAYGATFAGGGMECDCGAVFKLSLGGTGQWKYNLLHGFSGSDGTAPQNGLIIDAAGKLYGTTVLGGSGEHGVVFEITP
jgi:uncharacterized repeat protein (TIGR03803 family)